MIEEWRRQTEAALIAGINIRTAQHYVKRHNDVEEMRLPIGLELDKLVSGQKLILNFL